MFLLGLKNYLIALRDVFVQPALRQWLKSVLIRGVIFGSVFVLLVAGLGAWWISSLGESVWFDVGSVVWVLLLIYFSGAIFGLLMALGLPLLIQEKKLIKALSGVSSLPKSQSPSWRLHASELSSSVVSVFVSIVAWPFLWFPVLMPLGVVMVSWAYSKEAQATATRLRAEYPAVFQSLGAIAAFKRSKIYLIGLGVVPAIMSLIPFAAFIVWPTLLVTTLRNKQNG